jgi:hypothetical protein
VNAMPMSTQCNAGSDFLNQLDRAFILVDHVFSGLIFCACQGYAAATAALQCFGMAVFNTATIDCKAARTSSSIKSRYRQIRGPVGVHSQAASSRTPQLKITFRLRPWAGLDPPGKMYAIGHDCINAPDNRSTEELHGKRQQGTIDYALLEPHATSLVYVCQETDQCVGNR